MKNQLFFALLAIGAMSLSGCAKTPEAVRENMEQYNENKQIEEPSNDYCSIEELKKIDIKALNEKYDNIVLPEYTDFSDIEAVSLLNVQVEENFIDKYEDKFKKLFNISTDDFKKGKSPGGISHRFSDDNGYFGIDECGFMAYMGGKSTSDSKYAECYQLDKDSIDDVAVDFKSGHMPLSELCRSAEDWYRTNVQINPIGYKITDAVLIEAECENEKIKQAMLLGAFTYGGICFNNYFTHSNDGENKDEYYLDMIYNSTTVYDDIEEIGEFTVNNQTLNIFSEERQEKVVSFENAVKKVSAKLSGFGMKEFDKVVPLYRIVMHVTDNANGYSAGQVFEARPYYAFLIEDYNWKKHNDLMSPVQIYDECCLVDMITGEFISYLH